MTGRAYETEARWAALRTLRHQGMRAPAGVVLGRYHGQVLRFAGPGHLLVVAGTQTGKTASIVMPTLLEPQPQTSVLIFDPKGTLSTQSAGYRRWRWGANNTVVTLEPCSSVSQQYDPLREIRLGTDHAIRDTQLLSAMLVNPDGEPVHDPTAVHFQESASDFCTGLILCGLESGYARTLGSLARWLMREERAKLERRVREHPHPACQWAGMVVGSMVDRELGSLRSTVSRAFRPYLDPLVDRMTRRSDFDLHDLRNGRKPLSLYLSVPFGDQERLRALMRLLVRQWLGHAIQSTTGHRYKLMVMLEELPALRYFPFISEGLNYKAEYGVQLCCITPSMNELAHWHGDKHPFREATAAQCYFGLRDERVAASVSKRIGTHTVTRIRHSAGRGGRSTTQDTEEKPLLSDTALQQLRGDRIVLVAGGHKAILKQTRYYQQSPWQERSRVAA